MRLRHPDEPPLENRQQHVRREAPVAEAHDSGADADGNLVPLAHVRLCGAVLPAVLHEAAHRDTVGDERDIEHGQADRGEPEGPLRETVARERAADDARQGAPRQARREQRAAADDHHMRVREIPDQMTCVARSREPVRDPGQVLQCHVHRAEHEEAAAGDEVLGEPPVVACELLVAVRIGALRCGLARNEAADHRHDDAEERDVGQEVERGEVLDPHGPGATSARARGNRRSASRRGRAPRGRRG